MFCVICLKSILFANALYQATLVVVATLLIVTIAQCVRRIGRHSFTGVGGDNSKEVEDIDDESLIVNIEESNYVWVK
jgi:hypothetical protein